MLLHNLQKEVLKWTDFANATFKTIQKPWEGQGGTKPD